MAANNGPIKVFLDTNVMVDWFLQREPWYSQSIPMWDAWDTRKFVLSIPTIALTTIAYVSYKQLGNQGVLDAINWCMRNLIILNTTKTDIAAALKMHGPDFEDNVQIACAKRAKCSYIVTRNPRDFANSPIPVVDPVQLMQSLPA